MLKEKKKSKYFDKKREDSRKLLVSKPMFLLIIDFDYGKWATLYRMKFALNEETIWSLFVFISLILFCLLTSKQHFRERVEESAEAKEKKKSKIQLILKACREKKLIV